MGTWSGNETITEGGDNSTFIKPSHRLAAPPPDAKTLELAGEESHEYEDIVKYCSTAHQHEWGESDGGYTFSECPAYAAAHNKRAEVVQDSEYDVLQ